MMKRCAFCGRSAIFHHLRSNGMCRHCNKRIEDHDILQMGLTRYRQQFDTSQEVPSEFRTFDEIIKDIRASRANQSKPRRRPCE